MKHIFTWFSLFIFLLVGASTSLASDAEVVVIETNGKSAERVAAELVEKYPEVKPRHYLNHYLSFKSSSLKQANTNLSSSNSGLAKLFSEI